MENGYTGLEVAVVGMSCRVPQADNHREFWAGLLAGFEPMEVLSAEEVIRSGVDEKTARAESYVRISRRLKNKKYFDANFFKFNRNEAPLLSPQTRQLHECIWEAIEDAGSDVSTMENTGLFVSLIEDFTWQLHVRAMRDEAPIDFFSFNFLTAHHFTPALLSYKFGFQGITLPVISACSSSLVAIHNAYKSLLLGESKIAIAAGANLINHSEKGYPYQDGNIESRDGRCRSFDKDSTGTSWGEGVGVIVMKRLKDALKDNDHIYCLIKGGACNNDADRRVGYTAPSVTGQTECITRALRFSKVTPESIAYIETHGTGTQLGDPIEVEALNRAFELTTPNTIPIGSLKSNIGHTSYSAGILGFIKAALCLKNKTIPPSINFTAPNPGVGFANGPFYVNTQTSAMDRKDGQPLRAAVTSLGIGGTNAHMILEEAPAVLPANASVAPIQVITISAKTPQALKGNAIRLFDFLRKEDVNFADLAYTYRSSRAGMELKKSFVAASAAELLAALQEYIYSNVSPVQQQSAPLVFMFPGNGAHFAQMGKALYGQSAVFREYMDIAFATLSTLSGEDYKAALYADDELTDDIAYLHPLIFAIQYAKSKMLLQAGIKPAYMSGYSLGEYTAACLSGVFSFTAALTMLYRRALLMKNLPAGRMVSANVTREQLETLLADHPQIYISGENNSGNFVLSGLTRPMEALVRTLEAAEIYYREVSGEKPFHTPLLQVMAAAYREVMSQFAFSTPELPFLSSLTGQLIKPEEAVSPDYWISQMMSAVKFHPGIENLVAANSPLLFIDLGPDHTSSKMLRNINNELEVLTTYHKTDELTQCLTVAGKLWEKGIDINWNDLQPAGKKMSVPTYAFDKQEFVAEVRTSKLLTGKKIKPKDYVSYTETWVQDNSFSIDHAQAFRERQVLLFSHDKIAAEQFAALAGEQQAFILIPGDAYQRTDNLIVFNPATDSERLFADLRAISFMPADLIFIWTDGKTGLVEGLEYGYTSLYHLVRAYTNVFADRNLHLSFVANGIHRMGDNAALQPIKATAAGAVRMISIEFSNMRCRVIDVDILSAQNLPVVINVILSHEKLLEITVRNGHTYHKEYVDTPLEVSGKKRLSGRKTYLVTGGVRGLGYEVARHIAKKHKAGLIIIGRSAENQERTAALEKLGTRVVYIQSDLSSLEQLSPLLAAAQEKVGMVKGVIHAAGVGDYNGIILRRTADNDADIFNPKVYGTYNLYTILKDNKLDFFAGYSSRAVSKPFVGQFGYVAANSFLDNFLVAINGTSIHWPAVSGVGMAIDALKLVPENQHEAILSRTIRPETMLEVLFDGIRSDERLLVVSKTAIDTRTGYIIGVEEENAADNTVSRQRTGSTNEYVAPVTEMETGVADIMKEVLCIDSVGMRDNMFELGGDSLKAMVILSKIKARYNVDYTLKKLLEAPDIDSIVRDIDEILNDKIVITI
ncbi:type I polyketide synthase [Chitinophaga rhizophila]|uniref:SDR family NAD(P)-dependent oxidoreductase n=1 Tax=Chitinophaga rhizophila TaxID=2866212 RepID=A0ABS7G7B3_9BACT|nr:type I polyketide synthase [Chitinophaga rhizophila]MBW8683030.1 SDR family NAD(P)-dependent oxidoreductase [Chitinophaga rhizophila]